VLASRCSSRPLIFLCLALGIASSSPAQLASSPNRSSHSTASLRPRSENAASQSAELGAEKRQISNGTNGLTVTQTCRVGETTREIDNRIIKAGGHVTVTVCIEGLPDYLQKNNLRLSIGGEILSTPPEAGSPDQDYLNFILRLDQQDTEGWSVWAEILEDSVDDKDPGGKPLSITVAIDNQPVPSAAFVKIKLSSCADLDEAEAASQEPQGKQGQSSQGSRGVPLTPEVVHGWAPLVTSGFIRMVQQVTVCVMNLKAWTVAQKNHPIDLHLSIGGHALSIPPTFGPVDQEYVNFVLHLDDNTSPDWKEWAQILEAARQNIDSRGRHTLPITVANGNETFESNAFVEIDPYPHLWYLLLALLILLLVALVYFAETTDLLRYTIGEKPAPPLKAPYSLAITQMAFWFYLAVAGYVFICATTRQAHIPMGSVLGLLGISSVTGLAAVFVDKQKDATGQSQTNALISQQAALRARIAESKSVQITQDSAAEAELQAKQSSLSEIDAQLWQSVPPATTKGFINDLLHDGDGVSFHRFQMVVWTMVLGIVFVWSVYRTIAMPEFDPSLLTLMGISAGTYVGFKFPEKPKT
jgi:hypothetical protein